MTLALFHDAIVERECFLCEESEGLQRLSRDASDFLGRSISNSAIVRALIREVVKQGPSAADALFFEIEKELKDSVRGGSKQK